MDLVAACEFCLSLPHATSDTPFGPEVLVFKVGGKLFALASPEDVPSRLNLKCDPDRSILLREEHEAIVPGYHMNKRHWNTLVLDGSLPTRMVAELIQHSYDLVFAGLPRATRMAL